MVVLRVFFSPAQRIANSNDGVGPSSEKEERKMEDYSKQNLEKCTGLTCCC